MKNEYAPDILLYTMKDRIFSVCFHADYEYHAYFVQILTFNNQNFGIPPTFRYFLWKWLLLMLFAKSKNVQSLL